MLRHHAIATAALCCALAAACSGTTALQTPTGEPYVRGPVESITHHATASGVLVRAGPGSREPCGISATVDARTRYLQRGASGTLREAARSDLSVGDTVEVYVHGPVAESCPVQGYASIMVLIHDARSIPERAFRPPTAPLLP